MISPSSHDEDCGYASADEGAALDSDPSGLQGNHQQPAADSDERMLPLDEVDEDPAAVCEDVMDDDDFNAELASILDNTLGSQYPGAASSADSTPGSPPHPSATDARDVVPAAGIVGCREMEWAKHLEHHFRDVRAKRGIQRRKLRAASGCTGMFSEGVVYKAQEHIHRGMLTRDY